MKKNNYGRKRIRDSGEVVIWVYWEINKGIFLEVINFRFRIYK